MIGLSAAVYCCFQLSLCLAGPIIWGYRHLSLCLRRKITAQVFYSTFTKVFFNFVTFFTFLTFFIFRGTFFILRRKTGVARIWCEGGGRAAQKDKKLFVAHNMKRSEQGSCSRDWIIAASFAEYKYMFGDATARHGVAVRLCTALKLTEKIILLQVDVDVAQCPIASDVNVSNT